MHLDGMDSDFNEYEVDFKAKDNEKVKVEGNKLIFAGAKKVWKLGMPAFYQIVAKGKL